jgi:hypothetical protein
MPIISAFYGIIIYIYYRDSMKHHRPHIHAEYAEFEAAIALDGEVLEGDLPINEILPDASIGVSRLYCTGFAASGGVLDPKRE